MIVTTLEAEVLWKTLAELLIEEDNADEECAEVEIVDDTDCASFTGGPAALRFVFLPFVTWSRAFGIALTTEARAAR